MRGLGIGVHATGASVPAQLETIERLERAGIDTAWMTNTAQTPDPLGVLAVAGSRTGRIGLGTSIVQTYPRHPLALVQQALVVDHVSREAQAPEALEKRFEMFGHLYVDAFSAFGVDARLGAVPGEYCPGAHSVNARGVVKLVGTAQRVVKGAWLFSSLVIVGDERRLRPVLGDVYRHLDEELDPASVGSLSAEVPSVDADTVEKAVLAAYAACAQLDEAPLDDETLALAHELVDQHRVPRD